MRRKAEVVNVSFGRKGGRGEAMAALARVQLRRQDGYGRIGQIGRGRTQTNMGEIDGMDPQRLRRGWVEGRGCNSFRVAGFCGAITQRSLADSATLG